ncbi:HAD-IIA family hydrolase [Shouchella hunanensis]|uniref:HAD-IIA family hydrolase n=1 Tax=Shouchella hunanensis TaxID=766894 RepID=A0ABY7W0P6_9BACI|nr:HAD-IIA family hydrolase [Shouchella hunanensis]WDF02004.1 HAD-IIA family hydrolase [Shouchella hunanensis]
MIVDEFDVFFFDLDGVIYIGSEPLPEAVETLERLRRDRKMIRFLTNDPCTTRKKTVSRLNRLGIEASDEEVITSGWATAQYLQKEKIRTALVLGDEHLKWECQQVGITIDVQDTVDAVVVGWDGDVSFHDIQLAARCIHKGATFVATNPDRTYPTPEGPLPAVGAMVEAIRVSTEKRPIIVGKPYPYMFEKAMADFSSSDRIVMVGDNPYTDVLGAHQSGIPTILISDQETTKFPSARDFRNPDVTIPNLKCLFDRKIEIKHWISPSFSWPDHIKAGVAGIIFDEKQRVLLMKRADNGLWGIPSGHVEPGETVEEAIIREIREETGLQVKVSRLIGVYSDPASQIFEYPNGKVSHFITNCFECEVVGGNLIKGNEETLDVRYFDCNQLPEDLLLMHPRWLEDALEERQLSYIR